MAKQVKFEDKMNRLNEIVENLDNDELDLDLSIKLYEEGINLCKELQDQLKSFEDKVVKINEGKNE